MDLVSHRSVTEVSAVQQLPERWATYDNRCLSRGIVYWLPWKQMFESFLRGAASHFPCSSFLFPLSQSASFLFLVLCDCCSILIIFNRFIFYCAFLVPSLVHTQPPSLFPQSHPQWESFKPFLLLAFWERATLLSSPALSLGTLGECVSTGITFVVFCVECFVFAHMLRPQKVTMSNVNACKHNIAWNGILN